MYRWHGYYYRLTARAVDEDKATTATVGGSSKVTLRIGAFRKRPVRILMRSHIFMEGMGFPGILTIPAFPSVEEHLSEMNFDFPSTDIGGDDDDHVSQAVRTRDDARSTGFKTPISPKVRAGTPLTGRGTASQAASAAIVSLT